MLTPQFLLPLAGELVVDNFAGGGGASTGIERAIGRPVDIAINHDPQAIAMHQANHPQTLHLCESVWDVNPREVCAGRPGRRCWARAHQNQPTSSRQRCARAGKTGGARGVREVVRQALRWVGSGENRQG